MTENIDWRWLEEIGDESIDWAYSYLEKKGVKANPFIIATTPGATRLDLLKDTISRISDEKTLDKFKKACRQKAHRARLKKEKHVNCSFTISQQAKRKLSQMIKENDCPMGVLFEDLINDNFLEYSAQVLIARQAKEETKILREEKKRINYANKRYAEMLKQYRAKEDQLAESELTSLQANFDQMCEENAQIKQDMSSLKQANSELTKSNEELQKQLDSVTEELRSLQLSKMRFDTNTD